MAKKKSKASLKYTIFCDRAGNMRLSYLYKTPNNIAFYEIVEEDVEPLCVLIRSKNNWNYYLTQNQYKKTKKKVIQTLTELATAKDDNRLLSEWEVFV